MWKDLIFASQKNQQVVQPTGRIKCIILPNDELSVNLLLHSSKKILLQLLRFLQAQKRFDYITYSTMATKLCIGSCSKIQNTFLINLVSNRDEERWGDNEIDGNWNFMYLIEMMGGGIVPKISKLLTGIIYRANQFEM